MDSLRDTLCSTIRERLGWPTEAAAELADYAHIVAYEKNHTVFHAGEPSDLLYVLISGEVRLYYEIATGARMLVSILRGREILGVGDLHGGEPAGTSQEQLFTARAAAHSKVAVLVRARVARLLQNLPGPDLIRIVGRADFKWRALCGRLVAFMTQDVRTRLAHSIVEIARDFGIPDARGTLITLRLSHEDFADMIGASRPMISKCLNDLAASKIFVKQGGRYVVMNAEALARMVDRTPRQELPSCLVPDFRLHDAKPCGARSRIVPGFERGIDAVAS